MLNSNDGGFHSDQSPDIELQAPGVDEEENSFSSDIESELSVDDSDREGNDSLEEIVELLSDENDAASSDENRPHEGARVGRRRRRDNWVFDLRMTLKGCVKEKLLKAGSICRVSNRIRKANKDKLDCYRPQFVAMGPFHRATTVDLQTMELTKWHYMHNLLSRLRHNLLRRCSRAIQISEGIIRACYGDKIEMESEQFSTMMLLDACFLFELLLWLHDNLTGPPQNFIPDYIDDYKKMSRLFTDLTLLENQIPFFLLKILSRILIVEADRQGEGPGLRALYELVNYEERQLSTQKVARVLFQCCDACDDLSNGVYHFLYLIHSCAPDPYQPQDYQGLAPLQLRRCARKLQALGIKIICRPSNHEPYAVTMASAAIREFMDKFEFKIDFIAAHRELIIPTLHIKEETEVKWRNLIAWEQMGRFIGVGYKFTSYAYFFKGLVCSVHDIQLLKEKGVIRVHAEAKDEDLLIMFQSIVTGTKHMDARYRQVCERLNKAKVNGVGGCCVLICSMLHHCWRRFVEWLHLGLISVLLSFIDTYLGTPWKLIGVVVGAALLGLTITQTIYTIRQVK